MDHRLRDVALPLVRAFVVDRPERHLVPWRGRDTAFVIAFWALSAGILIAFFPWTL